MYTPMKSRLKFALCAATLLPSPSLANTLIDNVNGLQVGRGGELQHFTGIVIGVDGKVVRLLGTRDPRPRGPDLVVDGRGRALLPGLIDAHGHVGELGLGTLQLDLGGTRSIAELQQRLKLFAATNSAPRWIIGNRWNQELWPDKQSRTSSEAIPELSTYRYTTPMA